MSAYVEGLKKGIIIEPGYKLVTDFEQSANGLFAFAKKDGKEYFVKAFSKPKIPKAVGLSPKLIKKKLDACDKFKNNYLRIIDTFNKNLNIEKGQLNVPIYFCSGGSTFFQFSNKTEIAHTNPIEISKYESYIKTVLIKSVINAVSLIHMNKVVHSDLKFDNILVKKTKSGLLTTKIIDFDGSYIEHDPHPTNYLHFDQSYMAPELSLYNQNHKSIKRNDLTTKADIFSLGIVIHEYCTGKRPTVNGTKKGEIVYLGDAVNKGAEIVLDEKILGDQLSKIIKTTLHKDYNMRPTALDLLKEISSAHIDLHKVVIIDDKSKKKSVPRSSVPRVTSSEKRTLKSAPKENIKGLKIISKKKD